MSIIDYLTIPLEKPVTFGKRRMRQQADAISAHWVQAYSAQKHDMR